MNNVHQLSPMVKFTRDKETKIETIITSFAELVRRKGYADVTIRDIAEKAGVSLGTIYRYFSSGKPELASKLYERFLIEITPTDIDPDDPQTLEEEIRRHIRVHRENVGLYRAFDSAVLEARDLFEGTKERRLEVLEGRYGDEGKARRVSFCYGVVDAVVHRHIFIESLAESDEALVRLLVSMVSALRLEHI